jgi:hypothetical protein
MEASMDAWFGTLVSRVNKSCRTVILQIMKTKEGRSFSLFSSNRDLFIISCRQSCPVQSLTIHVSQSLAYTHTHTRTEPIAQTTECQILKRPRRGLQGGILHGSTTLTPASEYSNSRLGPILYIDNLLQDTRVRTSLFIIILVHYMPTTAFLCLFAHDWSAHVIIFQFRTQQYRKEKKQHGGAGGKGKWNDLTDGAE